MSGAFGFTTISKNLLLTTRLEDLWHMSSQKTHRSFVMYPMDPRLPNKAAITFQRGIGTIICPNMEPIRVKRHLVRRADAMSAIDPVASGSQDHAQHLKGTNALGTFFINCNQGAGQSCQGFQRVNRSVAAGSPLANQAPVNYAQWRAKQWSTQRKNDSEVAPGK